jgi:hypothetical protein
MPNLPQWGRGNFHAVEHWLAHLFDHHAPSELATTRHRPKSQKGKTRKRHPLEEMDDTG